jgi:putative Mg2+ transporter-C (MgtC) family protein
MEPILPLTVQSISQLSMAGALLIAALLGAALGIERSLAGKYAGMRTYALVSLGSCLFTIIGTLASLQLSFFPGINPLQIAGSIVIGIGFIGSGLAVFRGEPPQLTTATGIWLSAGVGMACGFGFYLLAASATALGLLIFSIFLRVEDSLRRRWGKEAD